MGDAHSFLVWACKNGVVTLRSGPVVIQLHPMQAKELGQALQAAASSLEAEPQAVAKTYDLASRRRGIRGCDD